MSILHKRFFFFAFSVNFRFIYLDCFFLFSVFKESPAKPPSNAQIVRREVKKSGDTLQNFKKVMTKRSFLLMLLAYGLHIGVFNAHATLLNRIFGFYFPVSVIVEVSARLF